MNKLYQPSQLIDDVRGTLLVLEKLRTELTERLCPVLIPDKSARRLSEAEDADRPKDAEISPLCADLLQIKATVLREVASVESLLARLSL